MDLQLRWYPKQDGCYGGVFNFGSSSSNILHLLMPTSKTINNESSITQHVSDLRLSSVEPKLLKCQIMMLTDEIHQSHRK